MVILGIVGASALRERDIVDDLVLRLRFDGWSASTVKRAQDGFDLDQPGKVSFRRREAGCRDVMLVGERRLALLTEFRDGTPPGLDQLVARLQPVDVVIVEGFKGAAIPTVEVFVAARHGEPRWRSDPNVIALVTDEPVESGVPRFSPADADGLYRFLVARLALGAPSTLSS